MRRLYYMARHTTVDDTYATVMDEKRAGMLGHLVGVCAFPKHQYYKECGHGNIRKARLDAGICASSLYFQVLDPLIYS